MVMTWQKSLVKNWMKKLIITFTKTQNEKQFLKLYQFHAQEIKKHLSTSPLERAVIDDRLKLFMPAALNFGH
jgi:predicted glycosyltransferase